ncbi:A24 family peptidase [Desulfolutivibrio sulfoxidireducens]|uniref:A24 family peptidase n=1 Tax=Desulfolutivibrio sulfoxidireducens TaxID=2773299 RepID=UPI00159D5D07|nr:prepilin peptidase [Desulfolutivibrio sulfoxidireducens]QLA17600.1 prepilin peptidase [Desulfolutivibrio sulfoxidireducens]QLA21175.1 prepilin peptidase [Desulfolutivibrio sulfoxidireducens]
MPTSGPAAHVLYGLLAAVTVLAAWRDARTGKIPNAVTFPAMLIFLTGHAILGGLDGLLFSLAGLGAGLTFLLIPHLFGYLGAGDVKLMAVVGAALGISALLTVFLFTSIAGGGLILLHLFLPRRPVATDAATPGPAPDAAPKKPPRTGARRVRYGVAIALGTVAAMAWRLSGRDYIAFF